MFSEIITSIQIMFISFLMKISEVQFFIDGLMIYICLVAVPACVVLLYLAWNAPIIEEEREEF
jgi:hypothetical protein